MAGGSGTPYIAHVLGVASIALENGANENEAIAALLHDAGEDGGGDGCIADIRKRFGEAGADIVQSCTNAPLLELGSYKAILTKAREVVAKRLNTFLGTTPPTSSA